MFPAGDLRASRSVLTHACDEIVYVGIPLGAAIHALAGQHVGLITAISRPVRLVHALEAAGVIVAAHAAFADHGPIRKADLSLAVRRSPKIRTWLASAKCAEHLQEDQKVFQAEGEARCLYWMDAPSSRRACAGRSTDCLHGQRLRPEASKAWLDGEPDADGADGGRPCPRRRGPTFTHIGCLDLGRGSP